MSKLTKNIVVPVSPEKIFDVIDDSATLPEIWPNMINVRELKRLPNGGTSFKFDYTMAGLKITGTSEDIIHERPNRIVTRTTGGVTSTLTFTFAGNANNTETIVTVTVDYEVPIPLLGKLAEIIVTKINETDIVYMLNYLKLRFK